MAKSRKRRRSELKRKTTGHRKEAIIQLPLTYNDGTRIAWDILESITEEIYVAFHGWTIEGTVKGAYRMHSGEKCVEDSLKVSIVLEASQIGELEAMVNRWCARLKQETMLLKITDSTVKFVPPWKEGGSP